ncbi:MAG: hypothetical protein ACRDQD_21080 [Nocardioidaceae bacterium]
MESPDSVWDIATAIGTVGAACLGSLSLVLAILIFRRDRENAEREQVDRVGAWATVTYRRRGPGDDSQPPVEEGEVTAHIRNASELPIRIRHVAYDIDTSWMMPDPQHPGRARTMVPGTEPHRTFQENVVVPPMETVPLPFTVNIAHLAPHGTDELDFLNGIRPRVRWLLVVDNAGRRWDVRPETGGRAKRVGRRWRPEEFMPREW